MSRTTTIRVERSTHEELKRLASARRTTVSDTVARGVRLLRQEEIGRDLSGPPADDEAAWLDADLG